MSQAPLGHPFAHDAEDRETLFSLMSGSVRKGAWEPPGEIRVLTLMGGAMLDFRDADLLEGVTEVHILAIMGGVKIVVPPDVHVDVRGLGVMGGFTSMRQSAADASAPTLRIRGLAIMGGVDVRIRALEDAAPEGQG